MAEKAVKNQADYFERQPSPNLRVPTWFDASKWRWQCDTTFANDFYRLAEVVEEYLTLRYFLKISYLPTNL